MRELADERKGTEARYRDVQLGARQRDVVKWLGIWFSKRIAIAELPCRGYWVLAVAEWQIRNRRPVSILENANAQDRLVAAREIAEHFRLLAGRSLSDPMELNRLDQAMRDGIAEYTRLFARSTPGV